MIHNNLNSFELSILGNGQFGNIKKKRFKSTNTCSFNLHLAYRSPDHDCNFSPINS